MNTNRTYLRTLHAHRRVCASYTHEKSPSNSMKCLLQMPLHFLNRQRAGPQGVGGLGQDSFSFAGSPHKTQGFTGSERCHLRIKEKPFTIPLLLSPGPPIPPGGVSFKCFMSVSGKKLDRKFEANTTIISFCRVLLKYYQYKVLFPLIQISLTESLKGPALIL